MSIGDVFSFNKYGRFFIVASLTDLLDGKIARARGLVTNFGKIMDPLADKILVYSALCLLIGEGTIPAWSLIVILAREFAVSGMRTVAVSEGRVVAAGMSGKIKTVLDFIRTMTVGGMNFNFIVDYLLTQDHYMCLADFDSYVEAQEREISRAIEQCS